MSKIQPPRQMPRRSAKAPGATPAASFQPGFTKAGGNTVTRGSAASSAFFAQSSDDSGENRSPGRVRPRQTRAVKRAAPATPPSDSVSKRPRHGSGYYDEASDSDDIDDNAYLSPTTDDDEDELSAPILTPRKISKSPKKTSKGKTKSGLSTPKCQQTLAEGSVADRAANDVPTETAEIMPPWSGLPYFVLVQIFEAAAPAPLDSASVSWLLATSQVCRAFAEPALTALYKNPPLLSVVMAHNLEKFLSNQPTAPLFKYRQKVEKLDIDVETIASRTYRGHRLDLGAFVGAMPRLKEVNIWHSKDGPPYRQLSHNLKWQYPSDLFNGLGLLIQRGHAITGPVDTSPHCARLQSWRWSSRMMGRELRIESLHYLHLTPCFNGLKRVVFVNYQLPSLKHKNPRGSDAAQEDIDFITNLAKAVNVLPNLDHLAIESSTTATRDFLLLLSTTIRHLELTNCSRVNAEDMADYLLSRGRHLRHLTLHHNKGLSLAFLPTLAYACPNLESLSMNLTYFNHHEYSRDSYPLYDTLLATDQVPAWPPTLQYLELKNLRKWGVDAAECLFQSLVDSAPSLLNLRYLAVKAMLDIPFRQRSEIRDKWVAELRKVFLRKSEDPLPIHSLRPQPSQQEVSAVTPRKGRKNKRSPSSIRRSHRIATFGTHSFSRSSSLGRDLRTTGERPSYAEPDTDEDLESDDDESSVNDEHGKDLATDIPSSDVKNNVFVQGMCHVVDVIFDNQKPVENQWNMGDFLDSESDDPTDDDWTGDRDFDDDYAW